MVLRCNFIRISQKRVFSPNHRFGWEIIPQHANLSPAFGLVVRFVARLYIDGKSNQSLKVPIAIEQANSINLSLDAGT